MSSCEDRGTGKVGGVRRSRMVVRSREVEGVGEYRDLGLGDWIWGFEIAI